MGANSSSNVSTDISFRAGSALVSVNPKVYPVGVVLSAAYSLLDKGYFWVGGSPDNELVVELQSKSGKSRKALERLCREFSEELLNCAVYALQSANNKPLREAILRAALFVNTPKKAAAIDATKGKNSYKTDPEEIAKPWTPDRKPKK